MVESAFYADVALSVYMKVKALGQRPEGCTAGATTLASYLGMSTSSVERGLAQLRSPRPDGQTELPENTRRSLPGGTGTTARRRVRPMPPTERFVWLPVAACEDLTPRQLRMYAVLLYSQAQRIPLTLTELAGFLRHYSGKRAGQPITATAAASIVDELEAAGWVTVQRRAGGQGRNHYLAHEIPPSATPKPGPATHHSTSPNPPGEPPQNMPTARLGEGSGSPVHGGSLASKEDHKTVRPENERRTSPPAVGETRVVQAAQPVKNPSAPLAHELALRADDKHSPSPAPAHTTPSRSAGGGDRPYTGPQLTLSPQIYAVLEPVHWLLQRVNNTFLVRQIAREVGRQLRDGMEPARLRHRLTVRFAGIIPDEIRDPGRWLLGVALPRWGCGHLDCEAGTMWSTGAACAVCEEVVADNRAARQLKLALAHQSDPEHTRPDVDLWASEDPHLADSRPVPPTATLSVDRLPRTDCAACGCRIFLTGKAVDDNLCKPCRQETAEQRNDPAVSLRPVVSSLCTGGHGQPCKRVPLPSRTVCLRHRAQEVTD
ncbi:hypothetical protein ACIBL5_38930 [Streptomyces sp. NPDC050516]|uniref:hypothetical protein n=1 Tax=Streptomyces sp. NPDC050516 TaxID=3365621 RepID=UPI0037A06A7E